MLSSGSSHQPESPVPGNQSQSSNVPQQPTEPYEDTRALMRTPDYIPFQTSYWTMIDSISTSDQRAPIRIPKKIVELYTLDQLYTIVVILGQQVIRQNSEIAKTHLENIRNEMMECANTNHNELRMMIQALIYFANEDYFLTLEILRCGTFNEKCRPFLQYVEEEANKRRINKASGKPKSDQNQWFSVCGTIPEDAEKGFVPPTAADYGLDQNLNSRNDLEKL